MPSAGSGSNSSHLKLAMPGIRLVDCPMVITCGPLSACQMGMANHTSHGETNLKRMIEMTKLTQELVLS